MKEAEAAVIVIKAAKVLVGRAIVSARSHVTTHDAEFKALVKAIEDYDSLVAKTQCGCVSGVDLSHDAVRAIWAALLAMVEDNHTAQDQLTEAQWSEAKRLLDVMTIQMDSVLGPVLCGVRRASRTGDVYTCIRERGHSGPHIKTPRWRHHPDPRPRRS